MAALRQDKKKVTTPDQRVDTYRETIESIAMAVILAFLFRTFIVEAFVIPTGSMATTLQGRHMEVTCPECDYRYQTGASKENADSDYFAEIVGTTCPMCWYPLLLNKRDNPNQRSFTGDRILVNKFAYALRDPQRWQVVVFRFPGNPKQPYIKRLVGLPEERLRIVGGDIYAALAGEEAEPTIARKPDKRLLSMLQLVHDHRYRPAVFDEVGMPHRWQPWSLEGDAAGDWASQASGGSYRTKGSSPTDTYLRYNHLVVPYLWSEIELLRALQASGEKQEIKKQLLIIKQEIEQHAVGELILDYYAYNDYRTEFDRSPKEGIHWVGDLAGEYEVELNGKTGTLLLDLVEGGVHYQCQIDVSSGEATLSIDGGEGLFTLNDGSQPARLTAATDVRGHGSYQFRFSNVDNELRLWVDGKRIDFGSPTTYQSDVKRNPRWSQADPLDAAPLGIGSRQLAMTVHTLRVFRDLYYVAAYPGQSHEYEGYGEFDVRERLAAYQDWEDEPMFSRRQTLEFTLSEDEFFPLGDNSPQSKDARLWINDPLDEFSDDVAIKLGIRLADDDGAARIVQIMPFGGAYATDIQPGDVVTSVDGMAVSSRKDLLDSIGIGFMQREIALELDRAGETIQRTVTMGLRSGFHRDLLVGEALMVYWPHPWRVKLPGGKSLPVIPHIKRIGLIR